MNNNFTEIDFEKWERRTTYEFFSRGGCNFNITSKIDITALYNYSKKTKIKLYPLLISYAAKVINNHQEFKYGFKNGKLGCYTTINPIFFDIMENGNAKSLYAEYQEDILKMVNNIEEVRTRYQDTEVYRPQEIPDNSIMISCLPWIDISNLSFELQYGYDFLAPILAFGKFIIEDERVIIPLSIYVNHKVIDGYHVSMFYKELEEMIKKV